MRDQPLSNLLHGRCETRRDRIGARHRTGASPIRPYSPCPHFLLIGTVLGLSLCTLLDAVPPIDRVQFPCKKALSTATPLDLPAGGLQNGPSPQQFYRAHLNIEF